MELAFSIAWLLCLFWTICFAFWGWFTANSEYYKVSGVTSVFCAVVYYYLA